MELLLVLAGLWVLSSPVFFLIAVVGGGGQRRRIEALERDLFDLRLMHDDVARRVASRVLEGPVPAPAPVRHEATAFEPAAPSPVLHDAKAFEPAPPAALSRAVPAPDAPDASGGRRDAGGPPAGRRRSIPVETLEPAGRQRSIPFEPAGVPRQGDWERWIGVRGAAALGAGLLVLAGLYFFKYSIDRGFLTPTLRVLLGSLAGVGCIAASELRLRRTHALLANWIAGAGIAILYTSFWAARSLYGLVGLEVGFGAMVLVTAACTLLSLRYASLAIAVLGLAGGFATPLALSTGSDRPIALFGYLLVLDVALLVLANRKQWPALGILSLGATALYEGLWMGIRMGSDRLWLGIAILLAFTAVFTIGTRGERQGGSGTTLTQTASVILPFLFAFSFAFRADLAVGIVPLTLLLAILSLAAGWIGRARRAQWIGVVGAASSTAILGVWVTANGEAWTTPWQLVGATCLLAAVAHVLLELEHARPRDAAQAASLGAALSSVGGGLIMIGAGVMATSANPWPWLAGLAVLGALLLRHAGFARREPLVIGAALVLGLGLLGLHVAHGQETAFVAPAVWLGVLVASAATLHLMGWLRRSESARRWTHHAAALLALMLVFDVLAMPAAYGATTLALTTGALAGVALASATVLGEGAWMVGITGVLALVQIGWSMEALDRSFAADTRAMLVFSALTVVALTAWPFLASSRRAPLRQERWAWGAAALAGPAFYPALHASWIASFGDVFPGLLPLGLAVVAGTAAAALGVCRPSDARTSARGWFAAIAIALVTLAIGLTFSNEWLTIGWALEGLALIAVWRRTPHAGLKYAGLAHLGAVTLRLVANPAVLDYHPRALTPVLNWLLPTYGIPAVALLAAWMLLSPVEAARTLAWEPGAGQGGKAIPAGAIACAAAAALVIFAWLNLTILDGFTSGPRLELVLAHLPARDLAISIAWAAYAIGLLTIGMARSSAALRWASLALILATVGKVFLYDLAHLRDLYRVASLVGLAISLIVISLAYQRFVFGPGTEAARKREA